MIWMATDAIITQILIDPTPFAFFLIDCVCGVTVAAAELESGHPGVQRQRLQRQHPCTGSAPAWRSASDPTPRAC